MVWLGQTYFCILHMMQLVVRRLLSTFKIASVVGILLFVYFFLFIAEVAVPLTDCQVLGQKGLTEICICWKIYSSTLPQRASGHLECSWRQEDGHKPRADRLAKEPSKMGFLMAMSAEFHTTFIFT